MLLLLRIIVLNKYDLAKKIGIYKESSDPIYYSVSLAGDLNGYCYKLIAGIIR